MMTIEQRTSFGMGGHSNVGPLLCVSNQVLPQSNLVSISSARPGPTLVTPGLQRKHIGRKGQQAIVRRKAVDCAFFTVTLGAVALLWWSAL